MTCVAGQVGFSTRGLATRVMAAEQVAFRCQGRMRRFKLLAKIAAALMGALTLVAFGLCFYLYHELNPYSLDSRSAQWPERFGNQPGEWEPVEGHLMTRWAADVSPASVLPEYPRPQMKRADWLNLNGIWSVGVVPRDADCVAGMGEILVPFPIESALSGVKQPLLPGERLCYERAFSVPPEWEGKRLLLHFGAVDWEAEVRVNGQHVGSHRGGYDPFTFDISPYVTHGESNRLEVAVSDPTDLGTQEAGKQRLVPFMISYTAVSGIWQTVWLEPVSETSIERIRITPDLDSATVTVRAELEGEADGVEISWTVAVGDEDVATGTGPAGEPLTLTLQDPALWSPDSPHLYDLRVSLVRDEEELDRIDSYFGMRKFSVGKDAKGIPRLLLNNEPLFQLGPLDQGYWPDGLYTAPTDEALRFDIEATKRLGFNMIRKHIKVEPARWYYHCDRLGIIVWQDMPSLQPGPRVLWAAAFDRGKKDDDYAFFRRADEASRQHYRDGLKAMIDALYNAPSIAVWVPFNEGWGQFDAEEIAEWTKRYDPSRVVDHASGWFDQGAGDLKDEHIYMQTLSLPAREPDRALVLGEFGGYGLLDPEHAWETENLFVYDQSKTSAELTAKYVRLLEEELIPLVSVGLSAAVYTQITDVEREVNGFLTYDREVFKMDVARIKSLHERLTSID
jgi:hypothetical protein